MALTIANMDLKLDFVPPALINFISRQLVGSGFKLYKKEVASVSEGDENFAGALKDPLYSHIREALFTVNTSIESPEQEDLKQSTSIELEQQVTKELGHYLSELKNGHVASDSMASVDRKTSNEIEEFKENDSKGSKSLPKNSQNSSDDSISEIIGRANKEMITGQAVEQTSMKTHEISENLMTKDVIVSPEVEQALGTLEKIIFMYRETNGSQGVFHPKNHTRANLEKHDVEESLCSEAGRMCRKSGSCESLKTVLSETTSQEFRISSDHHASRLEKFTPYFKGTINSHSSPASQDESCSQTKHLASGSFMDQRTESPLGEKMTENHAVNASTKKMNGHVETKTRNKKHRYWCFHSISGN